MSSDLSLSRRDVLAAMASAGALTVMPAMPATAKADDPRGYIDAHSHIWTRDVQRYPLKQGTTLADLDPPSFTTEELLKTAHAEGVDRVVLIGHHLFYGFDNTYMTDAAKQHPGVFRVVAMIDDTQAHPDVEMKKLLQQRVTGFRISPLIRQDTAWLESPGMKLMWKTAASTGQAMCCLINPENLPQVDKMCAQFPYNKVVIDHFARIGMDGEIRDDELNNLCALAKHKHTFVKISAYYALGKKKPPHDDLIPMIRRLYETFGAQRLMWASDSPYQLTGENNYAASIALVRDRLDFVSPEERDWLLRGTAQQVYFFDA